VQEHAGTVDVADLKADDLGDAQARGVSGLQEEAVAGVGDGLKEADDLVGTEDGGQGPGLLAVGEQRQQLVSPEGDAAEEAEGTDGLIEAAPGDAPGEKVELVLADVLGVELVGRAAEVAGEVGDGGNVGADGPRGIVAEAEVVDEPLTKGCHQILLRGGKGATTLRGIVQRRGKAQGQKKGLCERRKDDTLPTAKRFSSTTAWSGRAL